MVWKTAAGSGDKLGSESSAGLGCSSQSFAPASSAWFWDAALSPLWIKACCLSLVYTSVWYQRREEEGFGGLKAAALILTCDTGLTNSTWKVAA